MKKILFGMMITGLLFCTGYAADGDNTDVGAGLPKYSSGKATGKKEKLVQKDVVQEAAKKEDLPPQNTVINEAESPVAGPEESKENVKETEEDNKRVEEMKAYRDTVNAKEKEIDLLSLDLKEREIILKKKEAEKQIYDLSKTLPQEKTESSSPLTFAGGKQALGEITPGDVKITLLVVGEGKKEGVVAVKGISYSVKEGDIIAEQLNVVKIDKEGMQFQQGSGNAFTVKFNG